MTVFGPDGNTLFVADLGLDEVKTYRLNEQAATLEPLQSAKARPRRRPSPPSFSPERCATVFVLNELDSTVSVFRHQEGGLELLNTVSTLPEFTGETTAAAIRVHPSGRFLYASNRGHDSIAVFAFDEAAARLTPLQHVPTGRQDLPETLRSTPTASLLVAANQQTNTLLSYRLDAGSGKLEPTGRRLEPGHASLYRDGVAGFWVWPELV